MKFNPCTGECSSEGSHCNGCGRSHSEISETKMLGQLLVKHMVKYDYDNPQDFLNVMKEKVLKRSAIALEEKNG